MTVHCRWLHFLRSLLFCVLPLCGQNTTDVQAVIQTLYPKNDRLKEMRMDEIVRRLRIQDGSKVADVSCGPGDLSIILSHVVGSDGKIYCEDVSVISSGDCRKLRQM